MSFKEKYLKYKKKYIELKKQGGSANGPVQDNNGNFCPICFESMINNASSHMERIHILNCGHMFHKNCILDWKCNGNNQINGVAQPDINTNTCPLCRTEITNITCDDFLFTRNDNNEYTQPDRSEEHEKRRERLNKPVR
jgi:hypothetical protein